MIIAQILHLAAKSQSVLVPQLLSLSCSPAKCWPRNLAEEGEEIPSAKQLHGSQFTGSFPLAAHLWEAPSDINCLGWAKLR